MPRRKRQRVAAPLAGVGNTGTDCFVTAAVRTLDCVDLVGLTAARRRTDLRTPCCNILLEAIRALHVPGQLVSVVSLRSHVSIGHPEYAQGTHDAAGFRARLLEIVDRELEAAGEWNWARTLFSHDLESSARCTKCGTHAHVTQELGCFGALVVPLNGGTVSACLDANARAQAGEPRACDCCGRKTVHDAVTQVTRLPAVAFVHVQRGHVVDGTVALQSDLVTAATVLRFPASAERYDLRGVMSFGHAHWWMRYRFLDNRCVECNDRSVGEFRLHFGARTDVEWTYVSRSLGDLFARQPVPPVLGASAADRLESVRCDLASAVDLLEAGRVEGRPLDPLVQRDVQAALRRVVACSRGADECFLDAVRREMSSAVFDVARLFFSHDEQPYRLFEEWVRTARLSLLAEEDAGDVPGAFDVVPEPPPSPRVPPVARGAAHRDGVDARRVHRALAEASGGLAVGPRAVSSGAPAINAGAGGSAGGVRLDASLVAELRSQRKTRRKTVRAERAARLRDANEARAEAIEEARAEQQLDSESTSTRQRDAAMKLRKRNADVLADLDRRL